MTVKTNEKARLCTNIQQPIADLIEEIRWTMLEQGHKKPSKAQVIEQSIFEFGVKHGMDSEVLSKVNISEFISPDFDTLLMLEAHKQGKSVEELLGEFANKYNLKRVRYDGDKPGPQGVVLNDEVAPVEEVKPEKPPEKEKPVNKPVHNGRGQVHPQSENAIRKFIFARYGSGKGSLVANVNNVHSESYQWFAKLCSETYKVGSKQAILRRLDDGVVSGHLIFDRGCYKLNMEDDFVCEYLGCIYRDTTGSYKVTSRLKSMAGKQDKKGVECMGKPEKPKKLDSKQDGNVADPALSVLQGAKPVDVSKEHRNKVKRDGAPAKDYAYRKYRE